ncbi:MAG: tetratricopeptide repeat protein [Gammaproteobacteria bacterium]|nr:tetratricopeptide repeat protein [Gammaproteobacteria bacterium]
MSLLMDALKKAEEAKRKEKEASEQAAQAENDSKTPQESAVNTAEEKPTPEPETGMEQSENPFKLSLKDGPQSTDSAHAPEHANTPVNPDNTGSDTPDSGTADKTSSRNSKPRDPNASTTLQMNTLDYEDLARAASAAPETEFDGGEREADSGADSNLENEAIQSNNPFKLSLEDGSQSTDDTSPPESSSNNASMHSEKAEPDNTGTEAVIDKSIEGGDPSHRPPNDRTIQMNILDFNSLEMAKHIDSQSASVDPDETIIQQPSEDAFELADSPITSSEEEATLEAIEDLFGEAGDTSDDNAAGSNQPVQQPWEDNPPIDYEALMALKADNQQRAQKLFEGKQPAPNNRWMTPAVTVLTLIIIVIAGGWWYFWQTSGLSSETQFNIEDLKNGITEQSEAIDSAPQEQVNGDLPATDASLGTALTSATDATALPSDADISQLPSEEVYPAVTSPDAPPAEPSPDSMPVTATKDSAGSSAVNRTPLTFGQATVEPVAVTDESPIKIKKGFVSSKTNKHLKNAWEAYRSGDYSTASKLYSKVLKNEPMNRDALLGKAALAMLQNNPNDAKRYYIKLLERDPNDPEAQAALMSLIGQQDSMAGISQINTLLDKYPAAPGLHFTLGNLYAMQSRWTEAQQSFFQAWTLDSANPDYIYNLAISLDHLEKGTQALRFYQLAIDLASTQKVNFSVPQLRQRIQELASVVQ